METERAKGGQSEPSKSNLEVAREFYGGEIPEFKPSVIGQPFPFGKIGYTADRFYVRDREHSHFHSENGLPADTVKAAIQSIEAGGRDFITKCIKFDHPIGLSHCVQVDDNDTVISV